MHEYVTKELSTYFVRRPRDHSRSAGIALIAVSTVGNLNDEQFGFCFMNSLYKCLQWPVILG